jgi:hypothetical protein
MQEQPDRPPIEPLEPTLAERLLEAVAATRFRHRLAAEHRNRPRRNTPKPERRRDPVGLRPMTDPMATLGHQPRPRRRAR